MRLTALHEAAPGSISGRPGWTMNTAQPMGKRLTNLRSALRLIYGEPTDTREDQPGRPAGAGRPIAPGVGQLPRDGRDPGARSGDGEGKPAGDPQGTGGATGIPWRPRHRRFLGVNPSA